MRRDFLRTQHVQNNWYNAMRTMRAMLPHLWTQASSGVRWRVLISVGSLIVAKLVAVATPFFYKTAVDAMSQTNGGFSQWTVVLGISGVVVAYMVARFVRVAFNEVRNFVFIRVEQQALQHIGVQIITQIHNLSMRYHITRQTGALSRIIDRCIRGVESLLQVIIFHIGPLFFELVVIAVILVVVFDFWYFFIIAVMFISYVLFTSMMTEWRVEIRKEMNAKDRQATQGALDGMLNFETVKYFNAEQHEINQYRKTIGEYGDATVRSYRSLAVLNLGQAFIVNVAFACVLVMGVWDVQNGTMTVGDFVMIHAYMMQVMMPLDFLGFMYNRLRQALVDMGDAFNLLSQPAEILDTPNAPPLQVSKGHVAFKNVSFAYTQDRHILHDISFDVPPGHTVAIVGASGAGKSTIGRILFRFYDIQSGMVTIDAQDITQVTQFSLHDNIGVIPQDTVLFNNTIYYNLCYGNPNATHNQIEQVAKQAQLHDFITSLPEGYDTMVGERGLKLSGGEKQRVGIARTLLKDPKILLLDEATSALDTATESQIQKNLRAVSDGRTVIAIAHRLSTIVDANMILVLDKGKIVERGTHTELLQQNGKYAHMWHHQQQKHTESV